MGKRRLAPVLVAVALAAIPGVPRDVAQPAPSSPQLANPASVRCVEKGGALRMERRPDGGQYGLCVFADNLQCEEWAMFRGDCPVGGLRVTGYVTPAARYCAITGGRYTAIANSGRPDEQGSCALPEGRTCDAVAHYTGACRR